ncbi:MAG: cyclase family protein [Streptosporangiaceae bacterium]
MTAVEEALAEARVKYRNWGRWGPDDALGTLNYIDDAKRQAAAELVRTGRVFSLAVEFNRDGPRSGHRGRGNPIHTMLESGVEAAAGTQDFPHGYGDADDVVFMPLRAGTHWDGLGHVFDSGLAWNGRRCETAVTGAGDVVTGAQRQAAAFVSRGVLLDVGRANRMDGELPDGFAITENHLLATIEAQGSAVDRGDIVLIRTGQLARCRRAASWDGYSSGPAPGLAFSTLGWLHATQIAAIATDTFAVEVRPPEFDPPCKSPLHQIAIPNIGLFIGEMFDLETLADDCETDGVYEFLFVAAGLPITGGVGAPVNPIAIK